MRNYEYKNNIDILSFSSNFRIHLIGKTINNSHKICIW